MRRNGPLTPAGATASGRRAADEKARARVGIDEVDGRALAVRRAERVDRERDALQLGHGVLWVSSLVEGETVLGRAAALARDVQADDRFRRVVAPQLAKLVGGTSDGLR